MYLAYDQGLEHGPTDFNDKNINPAYILNIAKKGNFNAVILQKGVAEKYKSEIQKNKVPLILKLNGKTNLVKGEPVSAQLATVKEAVKLGAVAVGYIVYIGSKYEYKMLQEFENIQREAHKKAIPVIAWIYPRGKSVKGKSSRELMAYAARTGLEIGADIIKIKYNRKPEDLKWAVKAAGKTKIVVAGGLKKDKKILLKQAQDIMKSGCVGLAIGRNIWQSKEPLKIAQQLQKIIWKR